MNQLALPGILDDFSTISDNQPITPFIKWVGGKRQLLPEIIKHIPNKFNTYYEPFIGGGALLFHLRPKQAVISDVNPELVNTYRVVRDAPQELINKLKTFKYNSEFFYEVRGWDRENNWQENYSEVDRAARFIYLNRCGFNGLWRVNKTGQCNTPFGNYSNPDWVCRHAISDCSRFLQNIIIKECDFEDTVAGAKEGDLVYFDPPYVPLSKTSNFTLYNLNPFNEGDQLRLKKTVDQLTTRGVKMLLSNSFTAFTWDLYSEYNRRSLLATRSINSDGNNRGVIKEILVTN